MREIFFVDQDTKLVTEVEIYELINDEYIGRGVWRYYDYNKPFDEAIFSIENEIPDDIFMLYQYGVEDSGLEQGDSNEKQIVTGGGGEVFWPKSLVFLKIYFISCAER